MGIWFLSFSIANQAGKHIAKLTSVNEAAIVLGENFQDCMQDPLVKQAVTQDFSQNWLNDQSLDNSLANPLFVKYLNEQVGSDVYFIGTVQTQEAKERAENIKNEKAREETLAATFTKFLTKDQSFADNVRVLPKEEAVKVVESSSTGEVITCLRNDSLSLGLGVFRQLGFFAIGCGLLLFLLGPIISRWMHGIK